MLVFKTIREVARTGLISEYNLRLLVKQKKCPGIYRGKKFMVNIDALAEYLDALSRNAAQGEVKPA